jgi:uncharacterized protein (TIRG00374 family)
MKKILLTLLQVAVTAFALYWVFKDPKQRADMANAFRHADKGWLLAALAASVFSPMAAVVRWRSLLHVQKIYLSWFRVLQFYMVGAFFNLFLLGSTGGDAVKIFYLLREPATQGKRTGAVFAVIMDRVIGLLALIIMASVLVGIRYRWLTTTPRSAALLASFGFIMVGAVIMVVLTLAVMKLNLIDKLPARMPGRTKIIELAAAFQVYAHAWRATLGGIAVSFVGHGSFFFTNYFAARAVKADVSLLDISVIMPIVNTIVSLPISVSGVGVRENLFKNLLGDLCGVGADKAVPISVIGFLCSTIFFGLMGGVFYFFFRSSAGAPANVEQLQEQLEHEVETDVIEHGLPPAQPEG